MGSSLKKLSDSRDQDRIVYPRQFLVWEALMGFLLKLGSRRQIRFELDSPQALENLNRLSGCDLGTLAHSDTLEHFLGHARPEGLMRVRRDMIQHLIRMKALDHGRLLSHRLIVLDGTGQLHFRHRHCDQCLEATVNGQRHYYHNVLEAKLVTPRGLALSIGSEFIQNADPNASKQDCELKAFGRLAPRLKKDYPQLRLCFLGDALYANGTFLSICQNNSWKYFITFKEGSMPAVWQEYEALRDLCPQNRKVIRATPTTPRQVFAFVQGLEYRDDQKRLHRFHAFECREGQGDDEQFFAWITNFKVTTENVAALANDGGRCRWKIENQGFNIQKNGGFNLEHAYSTGDWQIKNWYVLLQIGHMILQLVECGSLLGADPKRLFGGLRTMAKRLAESIRNRIIPWEALNLVHAAAIQIRLHDTS